MNNNPIGVFDSGIGGLSVLKQIIKLLPNEKYIYYADTDNVPYGLKTKEQILEYVENAIDFLNSKKVKAMVKQFKAKTINVTFHTFGQDEIYISPNQCVSLMKQPVSCS